MIDPLFESLESRTLMSALPFSLFAPEGYAGQGISEFVPMLNPNSGGVNYELWAHFETGERDLLLATGSLAAGARGGETLSDAHNPGVNLVPSGRPYAVEIRSSQPIVAGLTRYDRGQTGEAFAHEASTSWTFPEVTLNPQNAEQFLTWVNTADLTASINVRVFDRVGPGLEPAFEPVVINVSTEGLRRGGLDLGDVPALAGMSGTVSIEITADAPLVAMYAEYLSGGGATLTLGSSGDGATEAYFPVVFAPAAPALASSMVSITNTSSSEAEVVVTLSPSEGAVIQKTFTIGAGRSIFAGVQDLLPQGHGAFQGSLAIRSFVPVHSQVTTGEFSTTGNDVASSTVTPGASNLQFIAEGFMDPARAGGDLQSTFTLYMPPTPLLGGKSTLLVIPHISATLHFADGSVLDAPELATLGSHDLHTMTSLLEHIGTNPARRFFSIEISSNIGLRSMLRHHDGFHASHGRDSFVVLGVEAVFPPTTG